ncbi:DNA-binding response regulator [Yoonia sp. BS5-3]|uniref:DNA-binding response regulator n=1 Tax=Yoonia phaeophyticola TaxID=3137369 RepID=A0ABZ3IER1_9RHOB
MTKFEDFQLAITPPNRGSKQTVLVSDRNPMFAEMLVNELSVTAALDCHFVPQGADLFTLVTSLKPDILILDPANLQLSPNQDLVSFGRQIRHANPTTRLLSYSFKISDSMVRGALEAGFSGCIAKDVNLRQLTIALAVILDGGLYFDKRYGAFLRPVMAERTPSNGLSEREQEVLVGFARGLSAKQISRDLNISDKTVDTYKARACKKLNLTDRASLVQYVFDNGWITSA